MPKSHSQCPRERRTLKRPAPPPDEVQHASKKQKCCSDTSRFQYQPQFWDSLSKIDLTRLALRELNRRNHSLKVDLTRLAVKELAGRGKLAAWSSRAPGKQPYKRKARRSPARERSSEPPVTHFLARCGAKTLKSIKRFTRLGGPDLSTLRNVR